MTASVYIARPGLVVGHSHSYFQGLSYIDGVRYKAYARFACELEQAGGLRVAVVHRTALPDEPDLLLDESDTHLASRSALVRSHALLLETAGNSFLTVARLGLLGAVTWEGMDRWRNGDTSSLGQSIVGRRDIAESMGAVGDSILGPKTYCYLSRSDWTSLPQAINWLLAVPCG